MAVFVKVTPPDLGNALTTLTLPLCHIVTFPVWCTKQRFHHHKHLYQSILINQQHYQLTVYLSID